MRRLIGDFLSSLDVFINFIHPRKTHFRFSHVSLKEEKELKSQLTISRSDREDSGIYKCLAENDFGRSEHVINLTVQEKPDPPSHLEAIEVNCYAVPSLFSVINSCHLYFEIFLH